jgi:NAD(P)-dependent dehydrogenase (short-subunit alcohol dehydrogenase family)
MVETALSEFGSLDAVVNNAGICRVVAFEEMTPADFRATIEVNLMGTVQVCRAAWPHMKRAGYGRIVNVSSRMGQLSGMGARSPGYRMSKAALNALTRVAAAEFERDGIKVNAMHPGWVRTDMGGSSAPVSVQEGADTAVWLATLPDEGPTGQFFENRKAIAW